EGSVECKNLVYAVNTYAGLSPIFKPLERKAIAESLRFYIPVFTGMTKGGGNDERLR
ncbi:hypothetical protein HND86_09150, partial [Neisseria meningitidis]|nr:hypothetical protein [Neisseria meningitidis]